MKRYYKQLNTDGTLNSIGYTDGNINPEYPLTEEEYNILSAKIKTDAETHKTMVAEYVEKVKAGTMPIAEVPAEFQNEVSYIINPPAPQPSQEFQVGYDQALLDLAETGGAK